MADYSDYYSVIARGVSGLPSKTDEARHAVYERARTALQERLRTLDPPISETDLAIEEFALETAIQRVEAEFSSLSFISTVTQFVRSMRDKLNG
jgi:hypothetical protein